MQVSTFTEYLKCIGDALLTWLNWQTFLRVITGGYMDTMHKVKQGINTTTLIRRVELKNTEECCHTFSSTLLHLNYMKVRKRAKIRNRYNQAPHLPTGERRGDLSTRPHPPPKKKKKKKKKKLQSQEIYVKTVFFRQNMNKISFYKI